METSKQTMRADARKNYEALVRVARKHLSRRGVSTSMEAIAREAGVGTGTLYRHFPDRNHLVFAALNAEGTELRAAAERLRETTTAAERLEQWLVEVEKYLNSYQGLPNAIAQTLEREGCPTAITCHEIIGITEEFLAAARQHGGVRPWVTGQDLFQATLMLAWLISQCPDQPGGLDAIRKMLRTGWATC